MAVGTPVASPAHGAFPELMENTGGGILYPRSDPRDVATALAGLIRNPAQARELGRCGAAAVRRIYTIQESAASALKIYARLAEGTKVGSPASI
jgi:glycosyltransferase involved in cell wall biosynthesis